MLSRNETQEKIVTLYSKDDTSLVSAALLQLKQSGRCRFRPTQKNILEKVQMLLKEAGLAYTMPQIRYGSMLVLRYEINRKVV